MKTLIKILNSVYNYISFKLYGNKKNTPAEFSSF